MKTIKFFKTKIKLNNLTLTKHSSPPTSPITYYKYKNSYYY